VSAITFRVDLPAQFLDSREQRAGFALLAALLISFMFIRTSARLMRSPRVPWWPGSVTTSGGLHLHHLVWGIVLMMLCGFLGFVVAPITPWTEILAGGFGVGAGLTLDEFALWIYLRDVYWTQEGRASLDAVLAAVLIGGLIMLGLAPFDIPHDTSSVTTVLVTVLISVLLAAAAIFKGKPFLGLVGIFVPPVSLVACLRLAAPGSPWARRFYAPDGRELARSKARYAKIAARRQRLGDAIGGAPDDRRETPSPAEGEEGATPPVHD
jgi:hypothetical protein